MDSHDYGTQIQGTSTFVSTFDFRSKPVENHCVYIPCRRLYNLQNSSNTREYAGGFIGPSLLIDRRLTTWLTDCPNMLLLRMGGADAGIPPRADFGFSFEEISVVLRLFFTLDAFTFHLFFGACIPTSQDSTCVTSETVGFIYGWACENPTGWFRLNAQNCVPD